MCRDYTCKLFIAVMLVVLIYVPVAFSYSEVFYVDISGDDKTGDGSKRKPWRTIAFAVGKIPSNGAHTLAISKGTFIESKAIELSSKINLEGTGIDQTIIKGDKSFYYSPDNPGFEVKKFLIQLDSPEESNGNQTIRGFTIDGSSKHVHGGIYVHRRNNVVITDIKVQHTNFCGIWILKTKNSVIRKVTLLNCAWGSSSWCSGALQFAYADNVEFTELTIDEGKGYGIKTLGHDKNHVLQSFKIHDSKISVTPEGLWQNGKAPNISIEIWANSFHKSEIYNCEVDNHISIVNCDHTLPPTGEKFRIHHNVIDLTARAGGRGYGLELTIHNAEVDHNIFKGGMWGISNWAQPKQNWSIHHNIFYEIENINPGSIINIYNGNLKNAAIYNNTVELNRKSTINFLECNNGGTSENIKIQNNLIINSNNTYPHYPSRFINLEKGASIKNLVVENNLLQNLPIGKHEGVCKNNIFDDPKIRSRGSRPLPFYLPMSGSPLIDSGCKIDAGFIGRAPDIGAYEAN